MTKNLQNIRDELQKLADAEIAKHSQKFFKTGKGEYGEGDIFLGIRVPVLRKLAKKYREISLDEIVELLKNSICEMPVVSFCSIARISRFKSARIVLKKSFN